MSHDKNASSGRSDWMGELIRVQREHLGLSQRQLGAAVRLHQSDISRIERGTRRGSFDEAVWLASALRFPIQWLLTAESRPGETLQELAMDLRQLGAADLIVQGEMVPGAF